MKVLAIALIMVLAVSGVSFAGIDDARAYNALGTVVKQLYNVAETAETRTAQLKSDGSAIKTKYADIYDAADEAAMNAVGSAATTFQAAAATFKAAILTQFTTIED